MKIGELNLHCGVCRLIEHCGEPWSDVCICMERRLENVDVDTFYKLLETSIKGDLQDRIDDAYERLIRYRRQESERNQM